MLICGCGGLAAMNIKPWLPGKPGRLFKLPKDAGRAVWPKYIWIFIAMVDNLPHPTLLFHL
jgi:hypothetical protein